MFIFFIISIFISETKSIPRVKLSKLQEGSFFPSDLDKFDQHREAVGVF